MISIANSGGYNTFSIQKCIERVGGKSKLISEPDEILNADRLLIPGVGHAKHAMQKIKSLEIIESIKSRTKPTLGVCLGMQLLFDQSDEGDTDLLSVISGQVIRLPESLRTPHMGWNSLELESTLSPLLKGVQSGNYCYFVHSYYVKPNGYSTSICNYKDLKITATVEHENFFATQFHPEKSGAVGEKIIKNFMEI